MEGGLDSIDSKSVSESASKLLTASIDDITATLGLRVPASIYRVYKRALSHSEQELVREILKQTFVSLVLNKQQITSALEKLNVSINVSVMPPTAQAQAEDTGTGILKLKRELERLQRELEKALEENIELKRELEKLSRQKEELQRQLQHLEQYRSELSKYREAVFALWIAKLCIERNNCDQSKLLEFLSKELARHKTVEIKESFIEFYMKQLIKQA
ncbi:MAG: hypothetical protein QXT64_05525 [Desulfurococcaceae archaeon]